MMGQIAVPTSTNAALLDRLHAALDTWRRIDADNAKYQREALRSAGITYPPEDEAEMEEGTERVRQGFFDRARSRISAFAGDCSQLTPEALSELAADLSPGGAHTGALLIQIIMETAWDADSLLMSAVIYRNWHGGKQGFQFLPDPAEVNDEEYFLEAHSLLELINEGTGGDPLRILVGEDRAFFQSLPERFTIYRGAAGISPEQAAAGVCWTTSRDVAEWFAVRTASFVEGVPILLSARVRKSDVRLAKAAEMEVVTQPDRHRVLQCRRRSIEPRPEFAWSPAT